MLYPLWYPLWSMHFSAACWITVVEAVLIPPFLDCQFDKLELNLVKFFEALIPMQLYDAQHCSRYVQEAVHG